MYNHKEYQNEYHKAMKTKLISFNPNNAEDMEIWNYLMSKGRGEVTPYIKALIREDMNSIKNPGAFFDNPVCTMCLDKSPADRLLPCSECPERNR